MIPSFGLRATLSPDASNDPEDVARTKHALGMLGLYRTPRYQDWPQMVDPNTGA